MAKLHVVQAEYGDCLIFESGPPASPKYILIDGGPDGIYDKHLKEELLKIRRSGGQIDLMILSHVDDDHVIGLLDFLADLQVQRLNNKPETIAVKALWLNSFSNTIGSGNNIEARFNSILRGAGAARQALTETASTIKAIREGNQLRIKAMQLNIPTNKEFPDNIAIADDAPPNIEIGEIKANIIGPTRKGLDNLKRKWLSWLDNYENRISQTAPTLASKADGSIPNLSSIMVYVETDEKRLIFSGDGLGSHILQGLRQAGLLGPQKSCHVDLFKLPHHGSARNVTEKFLETVTADTYVLSANGKDGNPDLSTLIWLVKAAKKQNRKITIFVTNETDSTRKLLKSYSPKSYGYKLVVGEKNVSATVINL
jgi:beta-lactamase superfamily II metal-dependent hydrolase